MKDTLLTLFKRSVRYFFLTLLMLLSLSCSNHLGSMQNEGWSSSQLKRAKWFNSKTLLGLAEVKSFDVYSEQQTIHLAVAGFITQGAALTIHYLHSEDGGLTWAKPVLVNTQGSLPIVSRGNDLQIAVAGDSVVMLWQAQGELPNQGPMVSVYSDDRGQSWKPGKNPALNKTGDQAHMDLVADQKSYFHAVWLEDPEENGYQSVRYARSLTGGQNWETATTIDDSTCSCCWNTLTVGHSGTLNLLYRDMEPRDMALQQSQNNGVSWQRSSTVGQFNWKFEGCPHIGGGLAESAEGILHSLVWTGLDQKQGLYYLRSDDHGRQWSMPKRLDKNALHGDIAAYGQSITAIWDEKGPEGMRIVGSNSIDSGKSWSEILPLSSADRPASHPRVVHTQTGIIALWTEKAPKQPAQMVIVLLE